MTTLYPSISETPAFPQFHSPTWKHTEGLRDATLKRLQANMSSLKEEQASSYPITTPIPSPSPNPISSANPSPPTHISGSKRLSGLMEN